MLTLFKHIGQAVLEAGGPYKFGSTQVNLPPSLCTLMQEIQDKIPDSDIDPTEGRETDYHVTVKYGLQNPSDIEAIAAIVQTFKPFVIMFGATSIFESEGKPDVVKVDVMSEDLMKLNAAIAAGVPCSPPKFAYFPHATIAYVNKGSGAQYDGDTTMRGQSMVVQSIKVCDTDGNQTSVSLAGIKRRSLVHVTYSDLCTLDFDPAKHPRDDHGQFSGYGAWIHKDTGKVIHVEESHDRVAKESLKSKDTQSALKQGHIRLTWPNTSLENHLTITAKKSSLIKHENIVKSFIAKNLKDFGTPAHIQEADKTGLDNGDYTRIATGKDHATFWNNLHSGKSTQTEACRPSWFVLLDFDPAKHPRDNKGRFGSLEGAYHDKKTKTIKLARNGKDAPDHIQKLKIPPAWKNVQVNVDPRAELVAKGKDEKGRMQSVYSDSHNTRVAAAKFARVKEIASKHDAIVKENDKNISDEKVGEQAAVTRLILNTGIRPGSDGDTGADKKAYGATTLLSKHVKEDSDGNVSLQFVGKKGVSLNIPVADKEVAADLKSRAQKGGRLFNTDDSGLRRYVRQLDGGGIKPKDFRTLVGTATAIREINGRPVPVGQKNYERAVKDVARVVSKKLGNTPTVALQSYIDPHVFSGWRGARSEHQAASLSYGDLKFLLTQEAA